ncbi:MAG: phosphoenolpyruvate--protein phosphotransferase [Candidatus Acidiferrales bacterium]
MSFTFVCSLSNGIHARPASHLAEAANAFASECMLKNLRNNAIANMRSVLAIISADIRHGDRCLVQVNGLDEQSAHAALQRFINGTLAEYDVPFPNGDGFDQARTLPRALQASGVRCCFGLPVGSGLAHGRAVIVSRMTLPCGLQMKSAPDVQHELEQLKTALGTVRAQIREKATHASSTTATAILQADLAIASDVSLWERLAEEVVRGRSAGQAVVEAGDFFITLMRQSESEYIRERASDIQEICMQLLTEIYGSELRVPVVELQEPSVVIAEELAPQQLLGLDRRYLKAIVLEHSGLTSHAVILASSLGIPAVVGVKNAHVLFSAGQEIVLDANRGLVVSNSAGPVQRFYEREAATLGKRRERLARYAASPAFTSDGGTLEVAANASSPEEVVHAFANGADGIGLFRTEALFLARQTPPSEDDQFLIYSEIVRTAAGRPVIIRTFDIGADKPVAYLGLGEEDNPFLGYRGVRVYAEYKELLQSQLRAIFRASPLGHVQIMAPMVSSMEEALEFKAALSEAKQSLAASGVAFRSDIPIGIMIEIPSVAFILDQLCAKIDFFSIGTNDLSQYFFAADRGNPRVAGLSNVRHPGFLRFLKQIVDQIHGAAKWVGMCGEMAADIRSIPLLLGLGLDEISLPSAQIPELKRKISTLSVTGCREITIQAISCVNAAEVEATLDGDPSVAAAQSLLSEDLVLLESSSQSKEEAIQEIVDAFYVAGRTEDRCRLEESIWAREAVYSTGLGYGFAAPHCKTDAITDDSIGILRLNQPIDWGSVDGKPVVIIILIALRNRGSSTRHMQLFSMLARKLMDESFRGHLLEIKSAHEIVTYIAQQLE